jgi:hypothetical protein
MVDGRGKNMETPSGEFSHAPDRERVKMQDGL